MRCLLKPQLWYAGMTVLFLAACSTTGAVQVPASGPGSYPPAVYTHRVATTDVLVYWNCTQPEPGVVEVDGVVQDIGSPQVRYLELNLVGADSRNSSVSQASASLSDAMLTTNQIAPFHLQLRPAGSERRLDLYYQYYLDSRLDFPIRNYARDVCSPTQHLAR